MSVMSNAKVIEQVDKIVDAINGISGGGSSSAIVSDVWDSTSTYTAGDYVIYQNTLYKCLATTTPGIVPSVGIYWTITRVSDELENITDDIDILNSTTTWKLLGTKTGNTSISLPSDFKELHIVFSIKNGARWTTLNVLKEDLSALNRRFGCGYYAANDNLRILLSINTSSISNFEAFYTGANVLDASSYTVYYR